MWSACDLHVHTRYSGDCQAPPEAIGAAALARGISMVAITDHHDVRGWRPAWNAAPRGVMVQPGVELTCPDGQSAVDILGVFRRAKDLNEQKLIDTLDLEVPGLGSEKGCVPYGVIEAVERIHAPGGVAIAAHALSSRGLLYECKGPALERILSGCRLDAIEVQAVRDPWKELRLPSGLA